MPLKTESNRDQVSAGGIVFHFLEPDRYGSIQVCLVMKRVRDQELWCLPKGHVEPNEKLEETALREVREETGVTAEIVESLGTIEYSFYERTLRQRIFKTVHFFLMKYVSGSLEDHDNEAEDVQWVDLDKVVAKSAYEGEREILNRAIRTLERHYEKGRSE